MENGKDTVNKDVDAGCGGLFELQRVRQHFVFVPFSPFPISSTRQLFFWLLTPLISFTWS